MKCLCATAVLRLCAGPAFAADFTLNCTLGDPYGNGNFSIWVSNNGPRPLHCDVGCTQQRPTEDHRTWSVHAPCNPASKIGNVAPMQTRPGGLLRSPIRTSTFRRVVIHASDRCFPIYSGRASPPTDKRIARPLPRFPKAAPKKGCRWRLSDTIRPLFIQEELDVPTNQKEKWDGSPDDLDFDLDRRVSGHSARAKWAWTFKMILRSTRSSGYMTLIRYRAPRSWTAIQYPPRLLFPYRWCLTRTARSMWK